jgi:hypothetical protein
MRYMVTFWLATKLQHPIQFTTPSERIRTLGVPLDTVIFTSSFIKETLQKDV